MMNCLSKLRRSVVQYLSHNVVCMCVYLYVISSSLYTLTVAAAAAAGKEDRERFALCSHPRCMCGWVVKKAGFSNFSIVEHVTQTNHKQ